MASKQHHINKPLVCSIAGIDPTAQAGQLADCRTIEALGGHPLCISTAQTAQNSDGLLATNPNSIAVLESQFQALFADSDNSTAEHRLNIGALKIGMIANDEQLAWLIEKLVALQHYAHSPIVVWDPVLKTTSDQMLNSGLSAKKLQKLAAHCDLITPNVMELEHLTGRSIQAVSDIMPASQILLETGAKAVLVTGGHGNELPHADDCQKQQSSDFFITKDEYFWLHSPRQTKAYTRGTGCVLSSAIATALAKDSAQAHSVKDAVVVGKMAINQGLRQSYAVGHTHATPDSRYGNLSVSHWPNEQQDMPCISREFEQASIQFPACSLPSSDSKQPPLGLYPVVDRAQWLTRLLPLGISTIQLRVKDLTGEALAREIQQAIDIAKQCDARLFINDYWQLAIEHGAYGVHLGQEDLDDVDIKDLAESGIRLGVSTHCYYEVARAHAIQPSYLACGPVYHTDSKQMPWIPHGIDNLSHWVSTMNGYPWVGIGGISLERIKPVAATGVSGVAMISAITHAQNPEAVAQAMLDELTVHEDE